LCRFSSAWLVVRVRFLEHYRSGGDARDAALAVKLHHFVRDQRVGHARVVLETLHQPPPVAVAGRARCAHRALREVGRVRAGRGVARVDRGRVGHGPELGAQQLLLDAAEQALEDRVVLAQPVDECVGALERFGRVLRPLRLVGLARLRVGLQVAEALALPAQAGRAGAGRLEAHGWRWRVRVGDAREARRRAALLVCEQEGKAGVSAKRARAWPGLERTQHAPREEAARALLALGALDRVRVHVEAVVGEARQRDALLGVLRRGGRGTRRARARRARVGVAARAR